MVVRCPPERCQGLKQGDWIQRYGATRVRDPEHLGTLAAAAKTARVSIAVVRGGKKLTISARAGDLGAELR